MISIAKRLIHQFVAGILSPIYFGLVFSIALVIRLISEESPDKPRFVWGPVPIINNVFWSRAMGLAGYSSETYINGYFEMLHKREDWDVLLQERFGYIPNRYSQFVFAFIDSLFRYDIFVIPFSGYFLGGTPLWKFEASLLKIAKKKIIVIPYGSDAYVYRFIRSTSVLHGLMMSYPQASKRQKKIENRVRYWCSEADFMIPGFMGPDGFGRWDVLMPSCLTLDLSQWKPSLRLSAADGKSGTVYVAHSPNHRGFKGSEFIIESVKQLQGEGLKVELILMEKKQNSEVRRVLHEDADILAEQIIFTGHGLNGLEGMASGLPTISNLEDENYTLPFRRWSFLNECPLVSASPETITDVLRKLVTRPEFRRQLGKAARDYVEKYHGLDSAQYLFGEVIDYLYGHRESLINLYHPLLGEYPKHKPRVEHPLVYNHIVD